MFNLNCIDNDEDKILITEAIELCKQNFFRQSYLTAYISGIECLKRRIFQLGTTDKKAKNKCVAIETAEASHSSTDKLIISSAKELFLINDIDETIMLHYFGMRSLYVHPYEKQPNALDCQQIINTVINSILSKVDKYTSQSIMHIVSLIEKETSYLQNDEEEINNFIHTLLIKTDKKGVICLFNELTKLFEKLSSSAKLSDKYLKIQKCILALYQERPLNELIPESKINDSETEFIYKNKNTSFLIFEDERAFCCLKSTNQLRLIELLKENNLFDKLQTIYSSNTISTEIKDSIKQLINSTQVALCYRVLFPLDIYYDSLIEDLKSGQFNQQNPVASYLYNNSSFLLEIKNLDPNKGLQLGRLSIEAASHGAWDMQSFIRGSYIKTSDFPDSFYAGLFISCFFTNYDNSFSLDSTYVIYVMGIISSLSAEKQSSIKTLFEEYLNHLNNIYLTSGQKNNLDSIIPDNSPLVEYKQLILSKAGII